MRKTPGIIKDILLVTLGFGLSLGLGLCIIGIILFRPSPPVEEEASPDWSPDGQRLAFECYLEGPTEGIAESDRRAYATEAADICTIGSDGQNRVRLTKDPGEDRYPAWSPDGSQIAYTRRDGIYLIKPDGNNQHRLVHVPNANYADEIGKVAWSPDGNQLLFSACLDIADRDVYVVDINTGVLTNLTQNSGTQDTDPMWTLNGARIVFLSTTSPLGPPGACFRRVNVDALFKLKVMNADGSDKKVVSEKESFYPFVSVSNEGQIAFITDLAAKTDRDYNDVHLYTIGLDEKEPTQRATAWRVVSWSPDGKHLAYEDHRLQVWEVETGERRELPSLFSYHPVDTPGWSPDGRQIAVTVGIDPSGFYEYKHICIYNIQDGTARLLIQK